MRILEINTTFGNVRTTGFDPSPHGVIMGSYGSSPQRPPKNNFVVELGETKQHSIAHFFVKRKTTKKKFIMGAVVSTVVQQLVNTLFCVITLGFVCNLDGSGGGDDVVTSSPVTPPMPVPMPVTSSPVTSPVTVGTTGWYLGEDKDNCINTCAANGLVCNAEGLKLANDLPKMDDILDAVQSNESYDCDSYWAATGNSFAWVAPSVYPLSDWVQCQFVKDNPPDPVNDAPRCDADYPIPTSPSVVLRVCCCTSQEDANAGITTPCQI